MAIRRVQLRMPEKLWKIIEEYAIDHGFEKNDGSPNVSAACMFLLRTTITEDS